MHVIYNCRVEKLGYKVPVFDFRLPAVMSMSADVHKYGLGAKVYGSMYYRFASTYVLDSISNPL